MQDTILAYIDTYQILSIGGGSPRSVQDALHLLAFHPCREDRGPGCRANPLDAGHFSVRAPWLPLKKGADSQLASGNGGFMGDSP